MVTIAISGLDRDGFMSTTSANSWRIIPGRVGLGQASCSSAPISPSASGTLSTSIRMVMAAVCNPLAARAAEDRALRRLLVEMERLRVIFDGEPLDLFRVERVRRAG
jgi:hypothetical protein